MKSLVFTTEDAARSFQTRANMSTGYPHAPSGSEDAVGIEKHQGQDRWAVGVATVWSWVHGRQYEMEAEMLSDAERADLVDFSYLVEQGWYPED